MSFTAVELSDLECIRQVANRYCRGVDRLDADEMKSAYWGDAIDDHGAFVGNAHEFVDLCMTAHLKYHSTGHCIFNHQIEFDDGIQARGEIYCIAWLFHKEEDVLDTWYGRYLDRYEKRGDEWRIIERVCVHEGTERRNASPMAIQADAFRQGMFDRQRPGRPIGP
jgi:hypothetical protein